jgi:hypothetical protein
MPRAAPVMKTVRPLMLQLSLDAIATAFWRMPMSGASRPSGAGSL